MLTIFLMALSFVAGLYVAWHYVTEPWLPKLSKDRFDDWSTTIMAVFAVITASIQKLFDKIRGK